MNGSVIWQGEEIGDVGKINVENNIITIAPYDDNSYLLTSDKIIKYSYSIGNIVDYMRTDIVLIIDEESTELMGEQQKLLK